MFTTRASDKSSKASLEQILGRLQAVLKALHLAAWLVLFEYILLAVSVPLELPLAIAAGFAAAAAIVGLLGGIGAMRWEPAKQTQRAMSLATALEAAALVGAVTFMVMQFRQDVPELADLRMLQVVALVQFVAGIMVVPFLARTTGRLGALHLRPLLAANLYWAEFVALAALVCWGLSFFTQWSFVTLFGHVGPVIAVGFQLAQRNVLIELMRLVSLGSDAAAALVAEGNETKTHEQPALTADDVRNSEPGEDEVAERDGEAPASQSRDAAPGDADGRD